jgi:hypothetical protein
MNERRRALAFARAKRAAIAAAAAAALALPAAVSAGAAKTPSVDLLRTFKVQLAQIKRTTSVPVLLPASLPILDKLKVYASGGGTKNGWDLELAFAPRCGGATACFLASFTAEKGKKLPGKANVRLAGGDSALFEKSSCGASCSAPSLSFVHNGVLYGLADKSVTQKNEKALLLRLANEAVAAGAR